MFVNDKNKKNDKKNDKKNEQDREELGYGYDKSVDDLKVIGQNNQAEDKKENVQDEQRK